MSPLDDKVRDLITAEAAEWFVTNREPLSVKERQAFFAWLRTSPAHVEEYLAYSVMARDLQKAAAYSDEDLAELIAAARTDPDHIAPSRVGFTAGSSRHGAPRWQPMAFISAACAVAGMGWLALKFVWPIRTEAPASAVETRLTTRHGQQKSILLADNSVLHLNTDSDVTLRYTSQERVVIVNSGEAEFEVAHEAGRPFRVLSGAVAIVDRGTKFDVLRTSDSTVVTVVQGSVMVSPAPSKSREEVLIDSDQQVIIADGVWPPPKLIPVDAEQSTAWLHRQIVFNHAPLNKVAAEFNRYARKPIEIVSPALQTFQISGVFSTDDTTAFIAFLRSLDSVRVEETATQIRVSGGGK